MVAWTRTLRAWSGATKLCWPCGNLPVADYSFVRRRVRWDEAVIHPSTLICETRLAAETPWPGISIHEDWDWLLRLVAEITPR